jgi:hypothetical protein
MRSTYEARVAEQIEIQRNILQGSARFCSSPFGRAWKGIFPVKAAEELASRTGVSVRTAGYQLSGEQEVSGRSLAALVAEITKRE